MTLFTGYLLEPRHIAATVWDEPEVAIEALDWAATRGRRQHCINMRDLGSMAFADAFTELALRAGFAADRIDIDAGHGDHILPTGTVLGERVMHWRDDELISTALDAICADIGWRWGIRANGDIFAEPFPVYGGMPDVTLDGDDEEQFVAEWTIERDMEQYANLVAAYLGGDEFYRGAALGRMGETPRQKALREGREAQQRPTVSAPALAATLPAVAAGQMAAPAPAAVAAATEGAMSVWQSMDTHLARIADAVVGSGGRMRAATVGAGTTGGPVHVSLNLDGRVIAQHVIDMERRMQYGYPQR